MRRIGRSAVWLLSLSLFVFAFYFLLADGRQLFLTNQLVSILSTAVIDAFRAAVEYKEMSILGLAVLLSGMTLLRSPTMPRR